MGRAVRYVALKAKMPKMSKMLTVVIFIGHLYCCVDALPNSTSTTEPPSRAWLGEEPMTVERIVKEIIDYFAQDDPHGVPVLTIPEPIYVEDKRAAGPITIWEVEIYGLSQIRLDYININLTTLTGEVRVSQPIANLQGSYEWPGWWSTSAGDANITATDLQLSVYLALGLDNEGILRADSVQVEVAYTELFLGFTGLSTEHSYMVSAADIFFSTIIQPMITGKLQGLLSTRLNSRLESALKNKPFPDSISPVDYFVAKMRRSLRQQNLDPFIIERKEVTMSWEMILVLKDITLSGITTIHRTHEVSAQFIDNAIFVTLQIGTQELKGKADWSVSAAILPAVSGHVDIEVESLSITIELKQPAKLRSPPTLRKIDIELGNLAVRSAGEGTLDYAVELLANILPNIFRNVIMDKLEPKIHQIIQKRLNGLDLHQIVMDKLAERRRRLEGTSS